MSTLDTRATQGTQRQDGRGLHPKRIAGAMVGTLAVLAPLAAMAAPAASARPAPISSAAETVLPAGCPDGAGALVDVAFENGRGGRTSDLRTLDVRHGDTVTMSWAGAAPGCLAPDGSLAIAVSLAGYTNPTLLFDPSIDETLLDGWDSCGGVSGPCDTAGGRSVLRVTLPTPADACNLQLDAVLGLPLSIIGPSGDFYTAIMRGSGPNLLVSAANFGLTPCVPPTTQPAPTTTAPTTPTTTPTTTPSTTPDTTPTTTPDTTPSTTPDTTPTTTPVTAPTTVTTAPAQPGPTTTVPTSTTVAGVTTTGPTSLEPASAKPVAVLGASVSQLPRTGSSTDRLVETGLLAAGIGFVFTGLAGTWRRRRSA